MTQKKDKHFVANLHDFPECPPVFDLLSGGFFSQWCCKCGLRHIWHLEVIRGRKPEDDVIRVSGFCDETATKLRKFYEGHIKSRRKVARG